MFSRVALVTLMVASLYMSGWAIAPNQVVRPKKVERLSRLVEKLGSGEESLVAVRLKDKRAIAGHVQSIGTDNFLLIERNTGDEVSVSYYQVEKLQGYNLASRTEVHEGTGIRAGLARLALKAVPGHPIPSNSLSGSSKTLLIGIIVGIILAIILAKVL
jgi:hypothetical protein